MLGDVLLITEKHEKAAKAIFEKVLKKRKEKFIIAISGESGSGKSELTHVLAKLYKEKGIRAKPIHIDNYYKIHPLERTEWRVKNIIENSVGLDEYDWKKINQNIEDFKQGKKSTMPCIDIVTDQVDLLTSDFGNVDILIIDGLYAIETDAADVRVFIELTYHETKKAQQKRGKEPENDYRMRVLEQEHQVVQSLKSKADIFIDTNYNVRFK